ncbi:MAG: type II toxin-antitoxin system RelE/ParE family toxin [Zoogloeaceae bacterium]|jgi:addiction module RelE/StbE family toxin|nr:type II toxin-antitoxin system RelE/ParE family toxin [Zoogloeaceae bacterium]
MKLIWAKRARKDRCDIRDYIGQDKPSAALAMDHLFDEKAGLLKKFPLLGRAGFAPNTRELVVHHNYILIYKVRNEQIEILRVMHTRRKPR